MQAPVPAVGWSSHLKVLPLHRTLPPWHLFSSVWQLRARSCVAQLCAIDQWCKAAVKIEAGITSLLPLSDPSLFSHVLSDSLLSVPRVLTVLADAESSMPSMLRLHPSRSITSISPCQAYTTAPRTLALTPKTGPRATTQSNTRLSERRLWSKTIWTNSGYSVPRLRCNLVLGGSRCC
ncbi:uncharacterized protein B0T23DRAFT_154333 [Neurospora hispaniola]|uniref:Uncharacterized protein n=1 Tax=Neurospora hispaniola TaxID=588809 RepID=A0AAJ0I8Q6_9PEZI|nr:hypothetical protein B0T23DRAFT_154333 [Neurospora hispaniola]